MLTLNTLVKVFSFSLLILFPGGSVAFAEHMFDGKMTFAQYLDITQIVAEKYSIEVDENPFVIYYGYGGTFESITEKEEPIVSSMNINLEKKSLEVDFDDVPEEIIMWIRLPIELISAEDENYQLLIDGKETEYDLTKFPDDYAIGMILPQGAQKIEIVGTYVIPEFGTITIAVFAISILSVIYLSQKKRQFLPL